MVISLHQPLLGINRAVGTYRSRCIIVAHRAAEVHVNDLPAVALKLMDYHPMEVLVVHGKVRAKGCGIIVVDDRLVWVWSVIGAEVGDECRDFQFRYAPVTVGSGCQVCDSPKPRANEFKQHALLYGRYYPARLLILAKKQSKYLEVTKFQSIFAKE